MVELCLSYEKVMGVMGVMEKRIMAIVGVTTHGFLVTTIAISVISNVYIIGKKQFPVGTLLRKAYMGQQFIGHCNLQTTEKRFSTQRDFTMQGKWETNNRHAATWKCLKTQNRKANNTRRMKHRKRKT